MIGDTPLPERAAPNLHLQQLAYLREVARQGSLTRAAEALHVSQPALSQALAELERRFGLALFERAGRGRRPTAAGQEVIAFAEETLALAEALAQRLAAYRGGNAGPLSVGMIDAASLYVLPAVVRRFRDEHPQVELKLTVATSEELLARLRAFALDLAFVVGPAEAPDLHAVEILREPLYLYAPAGHALDPRAARWVLYPEGSHTRGIIDAAFARAGIRPDVALESGNPQVLRQMVAMGLGWSVLPPAIAESGPEAAGLRRDEVLAERPLCVVRRRASPPDPRAEVFLRLALAAGQATE
ncbi:MAG TPA: LysR family transcriptional regulator [Dehalococcoidia bacterium]|nr:LysR family transcriptional regulator [Dehalococcoidia bacterium]